MGKLYNVSIINKHDVWLKEDEINTNNWVVMNKEHLEKYIHRPIRKKEESKGREIVDYDDIVWKKFL
jgi:hypothetical protein